jgi:hypothetical protein
MMDKAGRVFYLAYSYRTVIAERYKNVDIETKQDILVLRQPPIDYFMPFSRSSLDTFRPNTTTAFFIDENFGVASTSTGTAHVLLLPSQFDIGAIQICYRGISCIITFGLERRNWHRELIDAWIDIHDTENDPNMREMMNQVKAMHSDGDSATRKWGRKAFIQPRGLPDDCLEVSITPKMVMGDLSFVINGRVRKLTLSEWPLATSSPQLTLPPISIQNMPGTFLCLEGPDSRRNQSSKGFTSMERKIEWNADNRYSFE